MVEPFYTKRRLKDVRTALSSNKTLEHDGNCDAEIQDFFEDLVNNLAAKFPADPDAAFSYVLRNIGYLVQKHSESVYSAYGYQNPFCDCLAVDEPQWPYPVVTDPPEESYGRYEGEFQKYSALKMFGYTVGKTAGWPKRKREEFLSDFMELELPADVEKTFPGEYGPPMSSQRLRKVANVIAQNASNFARNDRTRYSAAIADWEDDLMFLKKKYYEAAGLKFQPWPSSG